ncbi:MAG: LysR family transcriptional regulator [Phycisphaerales bacterium]|nr:LysR family transcriptional regulator [Phycisphaerales bacterium]
MHTIRLICDVAGLRSFSHAAEKHGITQSAASQRVSQLERRLGVTLLDRSVRPLELTEAGKEFIKGCRELLERYDQLEQRISRLRPEAGDPAGEVRVDAIYSAGIDLLNQVRESFEDKYPKVRVLVEYKRPEQVYGAVQAQRCDVGILSFPKRWKQVGVIPLRNEPMAVVTAADHVLAGRSVVQAGELGDWPLLTFEPGLPAGRSIRKYLREQGVEPTIAAVFDNVDTIKSAVAVSQEQYAILPKRTVMREVFLGTLAATDLQPGLVRPMGIIFHRPTHGRSWKRCGLDSMNESVPTGAFAPTVQLFVDHLLNMAGPGVDLVAAMEQDVRVVARA